MRKVIEDSCLDKTRRQFMCSAGWLSVLALMPHACFSVGAARADTLSDGDMIDPRSFGAYADGVRDDTGALFKAMKFAVERGIPVSLHERYLTKTSLTVPAGVMIQGAGRIDVKGGYWLLKKGAQLSDVEFHGQGTGWAPVLKTDYNASDITIKNCSVSGGTGIWLNVGRNIQILSNTIHANKGYPIFVDGMKDSVISDNHCTITDGFGIEMSGKMHGNRISNNTVTGDSKTLTGIIIISKRHNVVRDNVIEDNTVRDVSEEGISVDYNAPTSIYAIGQDYRTQGEWLEIIKLVFKEPIKVGQMVFVLDGENAGKSACVAAVKDGAVKLKEADFQSLSRNTKVSIAWAPSNTIIRNNTITRAGRTGVMLYGSQVKTKVINNDVSQCGFAINPHWHGRTPYVCAGISALTIGQIHNQSIIHDCCVSDNKVSNCKVGLNIGVARWDPGDYFMPQGMAVSGNSFKHCAQHIRYEHGMSPQMLTSCD